MIVLVRMLLAAVAVLVVLGAAGVAYVRTTGLNARSSPGALEVRLARSIRALAVPRAVRETVNPVPLSGDVLAEGMGHFADHCASCHGIDGRGDTEMGRGLFPKAPDMRLQPTQDLTDGELFYIIENGVRFTGMPGWSTGTSAGEAASWHLVHVIRHLPGLTAEEIERMKSLTPRSPDAVRQEIEEDQFLSGGTPGAAPRQTSPLHRGAH